MGENTNSLKVLNDDIDCYGNYDKREIKTCLICGVRKSCSVTTKQLKENKFNHRSTFEKEIGEGKEKIANNNDVVELIRKTKKKQKKVEKLMAKPEKKVVKVSKEESAVSIKKVVKPEGKVAKKSDEKSSSGRPRTRPIVSLIGKTMLPVGFEILHKGFKALGEVNEKKSITTVIGDNGVIVSAPIVGRTEDKIELFVNRSVNYKIKDTEHVAVKQDSKSGTNLLVVKNSKKSQNEALEILAKWKKDQPAHTEKHGGKRGKPASSEKSEKKVAKVVKTNDKDGPEKKKVKVIKKGELPAKSEKKGPPVIKAAKKTASEEEEG